MKKKLDLGAPLLKGFAEKPETVILHERERVPPLSLSSSPGEEEDKSTNLKEGLGGKWEGEREGGKEGGNRVMYLNRSFSSSSCDTRI